MGPVSGVIMNAGRRCPSVSEAEPQLHASIFGEVVPLSPRADAGAPVYDERHCIQNVGQQMIARDGRRELLSGAVALFQPQTAHCADSVSSWKIFVIRVNFAPLAYLARGLYLLSPGQG